jgi:uridine phosphorylase
MSYPNYKNKHSEKPLFQAKDFLNYQKKVGGLPNIKLPKKAIMCYSRSILKYILENYKTEEVPGFNYSIYIINTKDNPICICGNFGTGAPCSITVLEELIGLGIKDIISIGTAGTLQKNINIGDIILCDKAIRDEGTSHHYAKSEKYSYSSEKLNRKIEKELKLLKEKYIIGAS